MLVQKGFKHTLLDPKDLQTYTQLSAGTVTQKQVIPVEIPFLSLSDQVASIFSKVELKEGKGGKQVIVIDPGVELHSEDDKVVVMQWRSDPITDTIADSVVAVLMQLQMKPSLGRAETGVPYRVMKSLAADSGERDEKTGEKKLQSPEAGLIDEVLESIFGKVQQDAKRASGSSLWRRYASIDMRTHAVQCKDDRVKSQIRVAIKRIVQALYPIDWVLEEERSKSDRYILFFRSCFSSSRQTTLLPLFLTSRPTWLS